MTDDTTKGTGALDVSDAQAAAVQKGECVSIDQLRDQVAAVTFFNGLDAYNVAASEGSEVYGGANVLDAMKCLTLCVIVLKNGFTVVGKSACADPANYDAEFGRKLARDDAEREAWSYLGFRLRDKIEAARGV